MSDTKEKAEAVDEAIREALRQTLGALTPDRRDALRKGLLGRVKEAKGRKSG